MLTTPLQKTQQKMLLIVIWLSSVLGIFIVIGSYVNTNEMRTPLKFYLNLIFYMIFIVLLIFRRKLSIHMQAIVVVFNLAFLALIGLFTYGLTALAPMFFLTSCIISISLLNRRITIIVIGLAIVSHLIAGYLYINTRLLFLMDYTFYSQSLSSWIDRMLMLCSFLSLVSLLLYELRKVTEDTIQELQNKNEELIQSTEEMAAAEEELRFQNEKLEQQATEIYHIAYFDALTGLPNRLYIQKKIQEEIESITELETQIVLFYIDIDNFKHINEALSHAAGDIVLKYIAKRLRTLEKDTLIISRLSGDEFAVVIKGQFVKDSIQRHADVILHLLNAPVLYHSQSIHISVSIGIAIYPDDAQSYSELLKNASLSLATAKDQGKSQYLFFNNQMQTTLEYRFKMESYLRNAIKYNELDVFYQPQFFASTGKIRGFEALMRWNSPQYGSVSPVTFIPILESNGMILEFGDWILHRALEQLVLWQEKYNKDLVMSVNISALQLKQPDFMEKMISMIRLYNINPKTLEIEITESMLIDSMETTLILLNQLYMEGIKIALDDFGTGFSSLNYLKQLPLHTLKIDKSFIDDINEQSAQKTLVGSIISLAHDINLEVIAEGVEYLAQKEYLMSKQCDMLQGYLYSAPKCSREMEDFLGK